MTIHVEAADTHHVPAVLTEKSDAHRVYAVAGNHEYNLSLKNMTLCPIHVKTIYVSEDKTEEEIPCITGELLPCGEDSNGLRLTLELEDDETTNTVFFKDEHDVAFFTVTFHKSGY